MRRDAATGGRERWLGELRLGPLGVRDLQRRSGAGGDGAVFTGGTLRRTATVSDIGSSQARSNCVEPRERADDRRAVAVALAEAEGVRRVGRP